MHQEIVMAHLGILVTTYCNLKCRNCADLIPKRERVHYEIEAIKKDVLKLLYHEELKEAYFNKIVSIIRQYSNVMFIDFSCDERFFDEDFCDFEHLNESGAVKLTRIIGERISEIR